MLLSRLGSRFEPRNRSKPDRVFRQSLTSELMIFPKGRRVSIGLVLLCLSQTWAGNGPQQSDPTESMPPSRRLNYHTAPAWTNRLMREQHRYTIPSPLILDDGTEVDTREDWYRRRRPELLGHWTRILGKLSPSMEDEKWFGDIGKVTVSPEHGGCSFDRIRCGTLVY